MKTELPTLLIIDYNADNLFSMMTLMQGVFPESKIITAHNGPAGIDLAFMNDADVVLLTLQQKETCSLELCKTLKADPALKEIPVIFVTDLRVDSETRIRALEAGADAFLPKPVDESELKAQIMAMVKIKYVNRQKANETEKLEALVKLRTTELEKELEEHKNTEKALAESEQKYRTLFNNSAIAIGLRKPDGTYIEFNDSYCNMLGYNKDELKSLKTTDITHPADINISKKNMQKITQGQAAICRYEKRYLHKNGHTIWGDICIQPLKDNQNNIITILGSVIDITERKLTEAQLGKLSKAVEQSPVSVVITNIDGIIEYVNPKFTEVTGYTADEALGNNPKILKSGVQPAEVYSEMWKTISSGGTWHGEFHNKKKNGELFWEAASISPITNDEGKITHYIAVKEDITQRKQLEEELKHQTRFRELLMEISSGFINIPFKQVDQSVNNALKKMGLFVSADRAYTFDYNWEDDVCTNTFEWCSEGISPEIDTLQVVPLGMMQDWVETHRKGEHLFVPDVFALPHGAVREILEPQGIKSVLTVPMIKEEHCIGFVGFDSVRTHHNYSNTELQLLSMFAQMLANLKMRKEMVEQLIISKEKAEESDQLKTAFINNVSHEIRTPLNGILGFGQFLADTELTADERLAYFSKVQQSSNRLMDTVNDFMDMARIVSGTLTVNKKNFLLKPSMDEVFDEFSMSCGEKFLDFEVVFCEKAQEVIVFSDKELLVKILRELLDNAVKFTKTGKISVGCRIDNESIEFYVRDTGRGISAEKQSMIFNLFTQEDASMTRGHEGSGLGLSIVKGIVELLGGIVWVESEKGHGATFYFTIPYSISSPQLKHAVPVTGKPTIATKPLILVAEDDESNYMYLEVVIKKSGCDYILVQNGEEAVETCRKNPDITFVLMDIKMPVMNGLEATKLIREFRPNLPIIALTAYAQTGDSYRMLQAGCDEYYPKPVKPEVLKNLIKKYTQIN